MGLDDGSILVEEAEPLSHEASQLLPLIKAEALSRYGDVLDAAAPVTNEPLVARRVFLLARLDGQAVGCAALRPIALCSVVAPRHRIHRAHNLKCRNFSTGS